MFDSPSVTVAYAERLRESLPRVRDQIAAAALSAGRDPESIRLVAVSKGHPPDAVRAALEVGLFDLGENRVEELEQKVASLGRAGLTWHMIGRLQSRKAKAAAELAELIHSVDSVGLAERLGRIGLEQGRMLRILAQVNTSGEGAKQGLPADGAEEQVLAMAEVAGVAVEGLMTMAPLTDDARTLASTFAPLRELRDRVRARSTRVGGELSMGMSNDMAVAVREGSTIVRIGTALFGERR